MLHRTFEIFCYKLVSLNETFLVKTPIYMYTKLIFHVSVVSPFFSIGQKSILRYVENAHILDSIVFRKAAAHCHRHLLLCWLMSMLERRKKNPQIYFHFIVKYEDKKLRKTSF